MLVWAWSWWFLIKLDVIGAKAKYAKAKFAKARFATAKFAKATFAKAIFAKGMEIKETKPEITPEEQKAAEENIKASIAELDPTALKEMEDQIDTDEDSALDDINLC